ncbi:helix-hairpin-helix domain-containing protein [Sediminitomix flava]|nr:helix-hairpin-helix domain-containing protein [Sediminitomix flava]
MFISSLWDTFFPLKESDYLAHEYDSLLKAIEKEEEQQKEKPVEYFTFNPNKIGLEEWEKLGMPSYLSVRIENFKSKGGIFYKKEDLRKIYGLTDSTYQKLEQYISIPQRKKFQKKYAKKNFYVKDKKDSIQSDSSQIFVKFKKKEIKNFDLNTGNQEDFKQIKGIGEKRAKSIINYRNKLGSFYAFNQLMEIEYFPEVLVDSLRKYCVIDKAQIKRIHINHISYMQLGRHPYLTWKEAKLIVNYREQHGAFLTDEDFKSLKYVNKKTIDRILPYLDFTENPSL